MNPAERLILRLETQTLDAEALHYLRFHQRRYAHLLGVIGRLLDGRDAQRLRILDIGPSCFTLLLREQWPAAAVDSLGFPDGRYAPRPRDRHILYDLNDAPDVRLAPYDAVVLAEVIEHLHTPARRVLERIASWIVPGGHLVVQTPNAVSLARRLQTLWGINPHEMIREARESPGHFCLFRMQEIAAIARQAGFEVTHAEAANYFGGLTAAQRLYNRLCACLPPALRDGITLCLRKPG